MNESDKKNASAMAVAAVYLPGASLLAVIGLWMKTINAAVSMESRIVSVENRQDELIRANIRIESKLDSFLERNLDLERRFAVIEARVLEGE